MQERCQSGWGLRVLLCAQNIKVALTDGAAHAVDSSEMAFKLACMYAFKAAYARASPVILEPIMTVEVRPASP